MGYGGNLKKALDENEITVYQLAKAIHVSPTTLYSAIQRDAPLSLENALKTVRVLRVKLGDICDISELEELGVIPGPEGPTLEDIDRDPGWGYRAEIEAKVVPILLGYKTVSFDQFLVPLLEKFLVLDNDGMKIALEVIEALHSTHPDHIREDYLDEAKHGAFTPQQTREYYREKLEEK